MIYVYPRRQGATILPPIIVPFPGVAVSGRGLASNSQERALGGGAARSCSEARQISDRPAVNAAPNHEPH